MYDIEMIVGKKIDGNQQLNACVFGFALSKLISDTKYMFG